MSDEENTDDAIDLNESDTDEEFRNLFTDAEAQQKRFKELAQKAEKDGKGELASLYREIDGTVLSLLRDVVASVGGAFKSAEERLGELEEDVDNGAGGFQNNSFLLAEDAKEYIAYFEQMDRFITELSAVPGVADDQKQIFDTLLRMTKDRLEFTKEIGDLEEDDDGGDDAPVEGEGVGSA
jgi:hypothetical protein